METHNSRIGTREQVFKGLATRTAGGLIKNDIIEKKIGNKIIYISKKLSEKMKQNTNPFRKIVRKKTISLPITTNNLQSSTHNQKKQNNISKTHKILFKEHENVAVNVYYPELKGMDIKQLKDDLIREEMEEDLGVKPLHEKKEFIIEDINSIDLDKNLFD